MQRALTAGAGGRESLPDDLAGQVEDSGTIVLNEAGVGGQDDAVYLEGEPVRVFAGGKLALLNGNGCEAADQSRAALLHDLLSWY